MTTNVLPIPVDVAQLSLQSFLELASTAEALQVNQDPSGWKVVAASPIRSAGTALDAEVDTTGVFIGLLEQGYPRGVQEAVVRELELTPQPGQPLQARLVRQAIAMAEASVQALQGVDFMTQLQFSAAVPAAEFASACRASGLAPEAVSTAQRATIDARMQQRFADAALQRQIPVAPETARQWLREALLEREQPSD